MGETGVGKSTLLNAMVDNKSEIVDLIRKKWYENKDS